MSGDRGPVRWLDRLRLGRPKPHEEAEWEIEHHLAELTDRLIAQGLGAREARAEAERRFGDRRRYGPSMARVERARVARRRWTALWDLLRQSLTGVARSARRSPGFTFGVVATLALGVGANATMYGVVDRLLLQPPAHILDAERVRHVFVARRSPVTGEVRIERGMSYPDFVDFEAHRALEVAAHSGAASETLGRGEGASRIRTSLVSWRYFSLLGVRPVLGRFFDAADSDPDAGLTAVLSEEFWRRGFGRDPDVVGRTLEIGGRTHTVVGVAPGGFTGVLLESVDAWLPMEPTHVAQAGWMGNCLEERGCWWLDAVVRLDADVSTEVAEAEATRLHLNGRREKIEAGEYPADARVVLGSVIAARGPGASDEATVVRWLAGVSMIVLLIACANVANLLLARGTRRREELAVRLALGVSRGRLVAQLVLEALILAATGGAVALFLARWGGEVVRDVLLPGVYFPQEAVNGRVLLFTSIASLAAGLLAGVMPALAASRAELWGGVARTGRGGRGGRSRLRSFLTVSQAAMSVVLLVGAGLFVRSLGELRGLDLGLDVERIATAQFELVDAGMDDAERLALYLDAARALERLPSVASAAVSHFPFQWAFSHGVTVPGLDSLPRLPGGGPYYYPVEPGYFDTVGLDILRGRGLEPGDAHEGARSIVVGETMARAVWPDSDPVGQCITVQGAPLECTRVVGVVEDAAINGYRERPSMVYYQPLDPSDMRMGNLYVRARGDRDEMIAEIAPVLRSFSPSVRYAVVRSFDDLLGPQARSWHLGATMFSVFGALALALAAIGLYSVLAFDVAQRTRELGIRAALGAHKGTLLRSVVLSGGRLVLVGVVGGLALALTAAPSVESLLFRVSPRDPVVLTTVSLVLLTVGAAASLVPALRATRVDPIRALNAE